MPAIPFGSQCCLASTQCLQMLQIEEAACLLLPSQNTLAPTHMSGSFEVKLVSAGTNTRALCSQVELVVDEMRRSLQRRAGVDRRLPQFVGMSGFQDYAINIVVLVRSLLQLSEEFSLTPCKPL